MSIDGRKRWLALYVLCLGDLMIVLDSTIVNVALPSIRDDLGFSETSLACGLAGSRGVLVGARAVQGLGGAVVSAVALSLIMVLFTEQGERAKAMGVFGFVLSGGGTAGVLLGGILTDVLSWHWIFLVNIPIGIAVVALSLTLLPTERGPAATGRLDVAGAVTVTASLMLAVYAIVNGHDDGWTSARILGLLGGAAVMRFGIKPPLIGGLLVMTAGVLLFARAPVDGSFALDILPSMLLQGFGAGIAFNPILLAAMSDVAPEEAGLASGVVNTAFMMGGALGLAVLASLADRRTGSLSSGHSPLAALAGAAFAVAAATLGAVLLRASLPAPAHGGEEPGGVPAIAEAD